MKHGRNSRRFLIAILLIALITPATFAEPLTRERVDSEILLTKAYPGSAVREFLYLVIAATAEELQATATAAAAEAARPLLVEIAGLEATLELLEEQEAKSWWIRAGVISLSITAAGVLGYGLGSLVAATRFAGLSLSN